MTMFQRQPPVRLKTILKTLAALAGVFLLLACAGKREEITILHFNDIHGQVLPLKMEDNMPGGFARLVHAVKTVRAEEEEDSVVLLFAGDVFTGTAFSALFRGEPEFQVFETMGVDAMTLGNHEWDYGQEILLERLGSVNFPAVAANITPDKGKPALWTPSATLEAGGVRIGVIGVTTQETPVSTAPGNTDGYTFGDPVESIRAVLKSPPEPWDLVVILSHCGIDEDQRIAEEVDGIDLIVGGHSHIAQATPLVVKGVPIVQAGCRGEYLGLVEIEMYRRRPVKVTGRLVPIEASIPEDPQTASYFAKFLDLEAEALGNVVGVLPAAMSGERLIVRTREAVIGNWITDALRGAALADAAFINAGAIRHGLPDGMVTERDLVSCMPFFDTLHTVSLTGGEIEVILNRCAAMAEKGPWGGFLQMSGIHVVYRDGKAWDIRIQDEPMDPTREYLVACTSFILYGGNGFEEFKKGRNARDWGVSIMEVLRRAIADSNGKLPGIEGRIVVDGEASKQAA